MSAFLLGVGFRADMGTCARKLVLLKLIDACDDDGTRIFPAVATVARAAQCSERQVQRELRSFQDAGLLRLVRAGGSGRRSTNEYALDVDMLYRLGREGWASVSGAATCSDAAETKGDTVSPLETDVKGDTGGTDRVTPETVKGDSACHPTPPEPSHDPSEERGREREAASEDQPTGDDPRRFERRVKKLAETHHWPNWSNSSTSWTVKRFAELTDAERAEAENRAGAYIATCGRKALALGTYFHERKWRDLPADAIAKHEAPQPLKAAPFGKLFGAFRLSLLMQEPQTQHVKLTGFEQSLIRDGKATLDQLMREKRMKFGWPRVSGSGGLDDQAARHVSVIVPPAIAPLAELMEPVRVGTERWEEWKLEHQLKGWPWVPDPGAQEWVYFPVGGPSRLHVFEQAVKGEGNVDRYDHAAE